MTSSHHNKVEIKSDAIRSITYIDGSLAITGDQPASPPPAISQSGSTWTIDMDCGRKGDSAVAGQFTNISGGVGHVVCPTSLSDASPSDLNFYFEVVVEFDVPDGVERITVFLGQGHRASRNNWWIGSRHIANGARPILVALSASTGDIRQVFTINGGISDFQLDAWLR